MQQHSTISNASLPRHAPRSGTSTSKADDPKLPIVKILNPSNHPIWPVRPPTLLFSGSTNITSPLQHWRQDVVCVDLCARALACHHRTPHLPTHPVHHQSTDIDTAQTQAIDDIYRTITQANDKEKEAEGKQIVEKIAKLKYEVQHDRALT